MTVSERFFSKVEPTADGCLVFTAAMSTEGYGRFHHQGKLHQAHRWLLERALGHPIDQSLDVDHLCRNRACVRPSHLEIVTRSVNIRRGDNPRVQRARAAARATCAHGHAWTNENTYEYVDRFGKRTRQCKTCMGVRTKARRAS